MALDFFGVKVRAAIETFESEKSGKSRIIELWTDSQKGTNFDKGAFDALSFVSQVNVRLVMGHTAKIQVVLTPPFEDGLKLLNSSLLQFGIGRLFVQFGYSTGSNSASGGHVSKVFSGLLQKPDVRIGTDIAITLNAMGVGYAMNITKGASDSTDEFGGLSWANAIKQVLEKYTKGEGFVGPDSEFPVGDKKKTVGFIDINGIYDSFTAKERGNKDGEGATLDFFKKVPPVAGTEPIEINEEAKAKNRKTATPATPEFKPVPGIQRGAKNDWWFVTEAVKKFGYSLIFEGRKIRISDQARWMANKLSAKEDKANKTKNFILRGEVDPVRGIYPILSFSSPTTAVWMSPGIGRISQQDITTNKIPANSTTVFQDDTTVETAASKLGGTWDNTRVHATVSTDNMDAAKAIPGNPEDNAARATARGEWKKLRMDGGITGVFTTLGLPDMVPGDVVNVLGFSARNDKLSGEDPFNGPYGVLEVKHSIGVGGFQTVFKGVTNVWANKVTAKIDKSDKVLLTEVDPVLRSGELGNVSSTRRTSRIG